MRVRVAAPLHACTLASPGTIGVPATFPSDFLHTQTGHRDKVALFQPLSLQTAVGFSSGRVGSSLAEAHL